METAPLVSIITPTFNSDAYIDQTIQSVLNQSQSNWELLLIDDASTDSTVETIKNYLKKHSNIKLIQNEKNHGTAISRNKGIEHAKGDYIAFLDADDLWKPRKLEKQINFMSKNNCDICFSSYDLMDESGALLHKTVVALPELSYQKFLRCNYIGNLTGIYNTKVLGKIYTPNLRKRQDWLLWLKAVKKSKKPALGIQEPLGVYRIRKNSISSNKFNLLKYNYLVYKKGLSFSTAKSLYYLALFFFEYFFVKSKQTVRSSGM
ncbi:glycosyltransferase family 2 protein [Hyunsoonleella sp. SJ7]|uniref:Glycosyltransferase family 2 protein n=1 Tax=Hyunsoonleella aquatilis TaxID=2762758 RepID=A0A923KLZ7_9FLAO|nr:glycosyltransferase family 2 protein [Hyunsoonleella aquatilis]MBC3758480.1 glycosyltransferase family 2 protein [Hyunsoonleella aquatilis]